MMNSGATETMTKADFCKSLGVDRSMANHWKNSGALSPAAFVGVGRKERVLVAVARAELNRNLDLTQRVVNGRADLSGGDDDGEPVAPVATVAPERVRNDGTRASAEDALRLERIRAARLANEAAEAKRRAEAGTYIRADGVARSVRAALAQALSMIESSFEVQAEAITAELKAAGVRGVDSRVLERLMVAQFRAMRSTLAKAQSAALRDLPALIEEGAENESETDGSAAG